MKKRTIIKRLNLFVLLILPFFVNAQFDGLTTSMAIDQIKNGLIDVIDQAEQAGNLIVSRSGHEMLDVIDAFKNANRDILDKAFTEISEERKAVLNQAATTVSKFERTTELTLDQAENMLDQVHIMVRDITFKKYPVLFRYRGSVIVPGETQDIRLIVKGSKVNKNDPYLEVKNQKYMAQISGENLVFNIPREVFKHADYKIINENAKLIVYHVHGGWFGFFQDKDEVEYDIEFISLPNNLGKAELEFIKEEVVEQTETRTYSPHYDSSSRSWDCEPYTYNLAHGDENGKFDLSRTSVTRSSGNRNGKISDLNISVNRVYFRICARRRITDSGNGFRHANVTTTEIWDKKVEEKNTITAPIKWNEDIALKPGENTVKYILTAEFFTGNKKISTNSEIPFKYADVIFDEEKNIVTIKPKIPKDILKL